MILEWHERAGTLYLRTKGSPVFTGGKPSWINVAWVESQAGFGYGGGFIAIVAATRLLERERRWFETLPEAKKFAQDRAIARDAISRLHT